MDERILKWLFDIQMAIGEIEEFTEDMPNAFSAYQKNIMLKRAVERNLEIIGEAMNRILKSDDSYENRIKGANKIVALRNHVIHAYDNISDENIWAILKNHLPKLKQEIQSLIDP